MTSAYKNSNANKRRAGHFQKALANYVIDVGGSENPVATNIGDFIADMIHYCIQNNISFETCAENAETHIASERSGRE